MLAVSPVEIRTSREAIARDLGATLLSRKRKLREVYSITTSTDLDNESSAGLAQFLEQNDLKKGRYFSDSTLPPRHYHAPVPAATRPDSTSSAPSADVSEDPVARPLSPESAVSEHTASHATVPSLELAEHDMVARTRARESTTPAQTLQAKDQNEEKSHAGKLAGVVIEQRHQPSPSKRSQPRVSHQQQRLSERNSRPVSPPYSPQEPTEDGKSQNLGEGDEPKHLSVLDTQREDGRLKSPRRSERRRGRTAEPQEGSEDEKQGSNQVRIQRSPLPVRATDSTTPPSSVAGHRSAATVEHAEDSPATSHDEYLQQTEQTDYSKHTLDRYRDEAADGTVHNVDANPDKILQKGEAQGLNSGPSGALDGTTRLGLKECTSDSVSSSGPTTAPTNVASKVTAEKADTTFVDEKIASSSKMEDVVPTASIPTPQKTSTETMVHHDYPRGRKRKRTSSESPSTFVLFKPRSDHFLSTAQSVRENRLSQGGHLPLLKGGYVAPLALRVALKSVFTTDLEHMMKNTSKTITTTDWMTFHREEQNKRVFDRILHLQNANRWSLRQLKRSLEPPPQSSHWDFMLQDVKWLQTDFREERKLKMVMAKQLADACAEYVKARTGQQDDLDRIKAESQQTDNRPDDEPKTESGSISQSPGKHRFQVSDSEEEFSIFSSAEPTTLQPGAKCKLSERSLKHIPTLHSSLSRGKSISALSVVQSATLSSPFATDGTRQSTVKQCYREVLRPDDGDNVVSVVLPPEETSCALFDPEWKNLRSRLNQQWPWKPPSNSMPPQSYYELRHASQWTAEDDVMLRQFVKESPSNWNLIADRMNAKTSMFKSNIERRTPWECYERLLSMEGTPTDAQARQYLRPFHFRIERAQHDFEARQREMQERVLEDARKHGSPPNLPHKRFPTPMRVERKPNKRFLALLDGARKLARKRENAAMKQQQNAQQQEVQAHRSGLGRTSPLSADHTPAYFSNMKADREQIEADKVKMLQENQRVAYEQARQARIAAGQQANLPNGITPQMRPSLNSQILSKTHLTVPASAQNRLAATQGSSLPGAVPNGVVPTTQALNNARAQNLIQTQQRMAALNGQWASSQDMQRRMAQLQQNGMTMQQIRNSHQQQLQGQLRGSPNIANMNNAAVAFNYAASSGDGLQSPGLPQQNGGSLNTSPNLAQQFAVPAMHSPQGQGGSGHGHSASLPQSLSNGHIPVVANLQAQIARSNPQMSPQEVSKTSADQLRQILASQQSRQNAMSAASGMGHTGNLAGQSQSVFPHQRHPSHPQNAGSPQLQGSSPYMNANMLGSNHQSLNGRPATAVANGVDPTAHQRYGQEMINRMMSQHNQQRQQQLGMATAAAAGLQHSPAIGNANLAINGMPGFGTTGPRTPGQGMRPPSRSMASGMDGQQLPRPGSAQSPRPLSASGFTG